MTKDNMHELKQTILNECKRILPQQIKWRRHFHMYPELSFEEVKTTAYINSVIKKIGLKHIPIKTKTGCLAELTKTTGKKTVAVRTDIDALPVTEQNPFNYKSKNIGTMHACGHDVHMTVVLGVASVLKKLSSNLNGNVRFIFQPAEETPPGGAKPMIEDGAMKDVSMVLGMHVDPTLATGKIGLRDGITMAAVTDFDLIIHGKGGHAAVPQTAVDPIVVASEVVTAIQTVISRKIDPIDAAVITFGAISGGTARNIICDRVSLKGTARTLSEKAFKNLPKLIKKTAENVCRAHGARLEMNILSGYPTVSNHPKANRLFERNYIALFGKGYINETRQTMGGEDFALYLKKATGAMFRLGIMNKKLKADQPWHSPKFCVDEKAIYYGTALLVSSVIDALAD